MAPYGRVLIASDGATDPALLAYVAALGVMWPGASFWLTHVITPVRGRTLDWRGPDLPEPLQQMVANGRLTVRVRSSPPLDAFLQDAVALRADLVLVGARDRRRTLARRLTMKAPCSIWMIPPGTPAAITAILAPVDFSPRSADALGVAIRVTATAGLQRCHVLHTRFDPATAGFDEYQEEADLDALDAFTIFLARIDAQGLELEPLLIESADVAGTVLRVAADLDISVIVMGTRGRSRAASVILGSETEQVLMTSPVPVLAVKHFGAGLRLIDAFRDRRIRTQRAQKFS